MRSLPFTELAGGLDSEAQQALGDALSRYANSVVQDDWPAMAKREESAATRKALDAVYTTILAVGIETARDTVLLDALLTELDMVTDAAT